MLKKILYSLHRVLGCILCLMFLVWFLSGFVMIYHTFPRVSNTDKYAYMDQLPQKIAPVDSIIETLPENNIFLKFSLKSYGGKAFYEGMSMDGIVRFSADDTTFEKTELIPSYEEIEHYAKKWNTSEIVKVDTLRTLEQWIPFGYLEKDFPIYKFYFGDKDKHQLYLSSKTGEALQFTNNDSRFWAWVGPIPHWVYFTSLRQNSQLWADTVIWLSGIGCIMCIAGIIMGIRSFIVRRQRKKKWETPYRKFVYKWHHILGFFFGIFVFTFVFSGMMSLANIPNWMIKVHNPSIQESIFLPQSIDFKNYKLDAQKIIDSYPEEVKSIEWSSFGQKPLYKIIVGTKQLTIDASTDSLRILDISETDIRSNLAQTHSEPMKISLMTEYDNYYVGLTDHLPLPVYKIEVTDADNSTYYINPKNASIRYFNTNSKAHKWTYQALHSYKFSFLAKHPVLWNIVMWTSMIGGTLVSITGVWLGIRYFIRKIKKGKKYLYTKKKKD